MPGSEGSATEPADVGPAPAAAAASTLLLARVRSPAEAERAVAAGFDGVAASEPIGAGARVCLRLPDEGAGGLAVIEGAGRPAIRLLLVDEGAVRTGQSARVARDGGAAGVLLLLARPLAEDPDRLDLAGLRRACGDAKLLCGFAGAIEAPDLPRLLLHAPDLLVLDGALRTDGEGPLDPAALALARALVPPGPGGAAAPVGSRPGAAADRIFLRGHVRPVAVGAYAGERGRLQRVRFDVEADLAGTGQPARDLSDVVSYDLFVDTIRALTDGRHVDLVETLAEELAERLLAHRRIARVRITLEKLDVLGSGTLGVAIERSRLPD